MKTKNNGCKVIRSKGKKYELHLPFSDKNVQSKRTLEALSSHFDHVSVSPSQQYDNQQIGGCERGLEVFAIRNDSANPDQEFADAALLLDLISPVGGSERVMLRDSRDVTVYGLKCD